MPRSPNTPCLDCGKLCWPTGKRKGEPHYCLECKPHLGRRHGFASTYRSGCRCDECRRAHRSRIAPHLAERRVRLRGGETERFSPSEVFDRDGWDCQICGDPIARDESFPHPLSVSLDHIAPVSLGGAHTRANTRCAHLICNTRRGNRVAS